MFKRFVYFAFAAVFANLLALIVVVGPAKALDTADSLTVRLARPVSSLRDYKAHLTTTELPSAGWTEFPGGFGSGADIPKSLQGVDNGQEIVVTNNDSASIVCITEKARNLKLVDGGPTQDCAKLLDAGLTFESCGTNAPDGGAADFVAPGQSRPFLESGDDCVFVRAGTNLADTQVSLVAR